MIAGPYKAAKETPIEDIKAIAFILTIDATKPMPKLHKAI
jgi:hypothetical protein